MKREGKKYEGRLKKWVEGAGKRRKINEKNRGGKKGEGEGWGGKNWRGKN